MIDHHDHRHHRLIAAAGGEIIVVCAAEPAAGVDQLVTAGDKLVRHLDRLLEQPTRIGTEVKYELLHALAAQFLQSGLEFGGGGLGETRQPDVAGLAVIEHERGVEAVDGDLVADDLHLEGLGEAGAGDHDLDLAPLGAAQFFKNLLLRDAVGGGTVDLDDLIPRHDPDRLRGPAGNRRDHSEDLVEHDELDANALKRALKLLGHLLHALLRNINRMGIQFGQQSLDRPGDQLVALHRLDVVALDVGEDLNKTIEFRTNILLRIGLVVADARKGDADHQADARQE
ncbi:MAG: hypothetical protein BWY77_00643 [bacterium ADurb.Bin431]|nr:MAG: hypothetical protein BWY77_00643 [bacterium ADurb.Bin431]